MSNSFGTSFNLHDKLVEITRVAQTRRLLIPHWLKNLPESNEITALLVNLLPITVKPLGTPFTFCTPSIQPTTSANGVRIFRECASPTGGFLITAYTRPSFVIARTSRRSAWNLIPFMLPDSLPLRRRFVPVESELDSDFRIITRWSREGWAFETAVQ